MDTVYIYTDGSSDYKKGLYGSGAVLLTNDKEDATIISEVSRAGKFSSLVKYNNISGEILGCCYGLEEAIKLGYKQAIVYVDYIGLIKWYEGTWQARNKLSQTYVKMLREYRKSIDINFVKTKGHSNDYWNDYADMLAKKSIGK
nr:MAG TPA: reverse transcriptase [Herelleviridae sp.]